MRIFSLFFSYLLGRFNKKTKSIKEMALEVFDELSFRSRRLVSLSLTALGSVILFCGGLLIILMETSSQYDHLGYLTWTAMLASGLGLLLVSSFVFSFIFLFAWQPPQGEMRTLASEETRSISPVETALATLILEYAKSLQSRHEQTAPHGGTEQPLSPETPAQFH